MATTANIYSHIDSTSKLASANAIGEVLGDEQEQEYAKAQETESKE
ncbi:MAG: hypothetical protein K0Q85_1139 [Caproiciproducens sp.]|jgi:hypothetical protein|nr:hypothetical protein [Caproiciproducens sp.]